MNQEVLKKNFEGHQFKTSFFETKEQAAEYLKAQIKGQRVAFGGSVTLQEMGLFDVLSEENEVIWHWNKPGTETLAEAREAQIYITSVNGVAETGELVNIDGTGNRVAQTLYGPEKVYFVVGMNKIEKDLNAALSRARNVAAPLNAQRLKTNTPCSRTGERCFDCISEARICRATVILERPTYGVKAEILFVNEELGY
ncbi:MAG: lactate utilization protein [Clostridium sp.]|nr:lactate utilization protein [Clostridium sp.]